MKLINTICLIFLILFVISPCLAQTSASKTKDADQYFSAKNWSQAAEAYEEITREDPSNALAWYQLGMSRLALNQFEMAIPAFERNVELKGNPLAMYNIAGAYARLNQKEKALDWLFKAVSNRLPLYIAIVDNTDFATVGDDTRFKEIVALHDKARRPCMYSPPARRFDFWVGEWDVFTTQGQKVGTSLVQQISEGCAVLENWRSAGGLSGKSINFYDPNTQKWYQYWMGSNGMPVRYAGTYTDGAMRYETEPSVTGGARMLQRLTFFNLDANTVRQLAEQSRDDGKTWIVTYDFKYVRTNNVKTPA
jgi:tetratricopeptide (TPR) repeat protein